MLEQSRVSAGMLLLPGPPSFNPESAELWEKSHVKSDVFVRGRGMLVLGSIPSWLLGLSFACNLGNRGRTTSSSPSLNPWSSPFFALASILPLSS